MPVPFLIPIIAGVGGVILGALSRQPEVNRLKNQVKTLQAEIQRLQRVIKEQDRQIKELKVRYSTLKAYHFIEKSKHKSKIKGAIMFQYCFKEYMDLLIMQARSSKNQLTEEELYFFNIFERMTNNTEITIEEKMFLRGYIRDKYSFQIDRMIAPNNGDIIEKVENFHVA
ncbi:hypothetical protein [Neobacillus sp. YIM B06451]|uniref:hypothetical protein n=1 Tax=Neobacillus sp. YIM B06451 TaxID=3070994 RepID=UPI002930B31E|nr:hypothetical protein [Neobacillus sp. YIM B06451]